MTLDDKTRKDLRNISVGGVVGGLFGEWISDLFKHKKQQLIYISSGAFLGGLLEYLKSKGALTKAVDYVNDKADYLFKGKNKQQD
ncbi:hypothetical protein KY348_06855 [Candidatus Woesearchaeota archaeon]|nr:hypothetical protein [Candidatus Woesearchaeota archaeon]